MRRKIASYTYLTRAAQDEIEWDEQTHDVRRAEELPDPREAETLLAFPPGATSGILLHEILEKIDFTRVADERTKSLVMIYHAQVFDLHVGMPIMWRCYLPRGGGAGQRNDVRP